MGHFSGRFERPFTWEMDMGIDKLIDSVIAREGEYPNHPADKGGPMRWGITE